MKIWTKDYYQEWNPARNEHYSWEWQNAILSIARITEDDRIIPHEVIPHKLDGPAVIMTADDPSFTLDLGGWYLHGIQWARANDQ